MIVSVLCMLKVDAALGAEEMVQQLADSKLTLEERVKDLEEAVADLEALQDMSEQLQEGSRELEIELREEVDLANFATREVWFLWVTYHVCDVGSWNCPWKCRIKYWIAYWSISQHTGILLLSDLNILHPYCVCTFHLCSFCNMSYSSQEISKNWAFWKWQLFPSSILLLESKRVVQLFIAGTAWERSSIRNTSGPRTDHC